MPSNITCGAGGGDGSEGENGDDVDDGAGDDNIGEN